jgi:hypothetical protein
VVGKCRVSSLTGWLTDTSSSADLRRGWFGGARGLGRRILRCDKANGENAASQPVPQLEACVSARRSRLKIVADVVGMISYQYHVARSSFGSEKATPIRSDRTQWIPTEVGVGPRPAESIIGLMEKMLHSANGHVWHHVPGRILLPQACGELFQPLTAIWDVDP